MHLLESDLVDALQVFVDDFISRVSFMPYDLTSKCSFQVLDGLFLMY